METLPFVFLTRGLTNQFVGTNFSESSPFSQILDDDSLYDFIIQWKSNNSTNDNVFIGSHLAGSTRFDNTNLISDIVKHITVSDTKLIRVFQKLFESNCSGNKIALSDLVWGDVTKPIEFLKIEESQCSTEDTIITNFKVNCYRMTQQNDLIKLEYCYVSGSGEVPI